MARLLLAEVPPAALLFSGDQQSGTDALLLSGDAAGGDTAATVAGAIPDPTAAGVAVEIFRATIAGTIPAATATGLGGGPPSSAVIAGSVPAPTAVAAALEIFQVAIAGAVPAPTGTGYLFKVIPEYVASSIGSIYSLQLGIVGRLKAGVQSLNAEINKPFTFTRVSWIVSADRGAMPTGRDAILDLRRSRDHGATWESVFPEGQFIRIVPGGPRYGELAVFALPGAQAGDWMRAICLQGGLGSPGRGVTVHLHGEEG
jgi:hypothetical protein